MVKIYILNLDKHIDRKKEMQIRLSLIKNIDYEFVSGIDGKNITDDYLDKNNIKVNEFFRNPFSYNSITMGEIGCCLSHIKIWEKIVYDNTQTAVILEDDCIFDNDFEYLISSINERKIFEKADMVYLGRKVFNENEPTMINLKYHSLVKPNFSYWTIGYMISLQGVKKLINSTLKNNIIPVDEFLPICYLKPISNQFNVKDLRCLAIKPSIITAKNNAFEYSETESSKYYNYSYTKLNQFYKDQLLCISVASNKNHGYYRFKQSANVYGFPNIVLGLEEKWKGNNMSLGPGGGQKINLLKKYLNSLSKDCDEKMIVFSDNYDAVITGTPEQLLEKFKKFNCDILFSAEALLWPDESLEDKFPKYTDTPYRFLNSGGFIGKIRHIKSLIHKPIKDNEDDQLYYQQRFLESLDKKNLQIKLDIYTEIFQTLSSHLYDINIDYDRSKITNDITMNSSIFLHGNGGILSKLFLNSLCNYINLRYRPIYKYKDLHSDYLKFKKLNYHQYPKIIIYTYITDKTNLENILSIYEQKYPRNKCMYIFHNFSNIPINSYFSELMLSTNTEIINEIDSTNIFETIKIKIIELFSKDYNYLFLGNHRHVITHKKTFKKLICSNLDIVSPLLISKTNPNFSNFWGEIDDNGYYKRSFDYHQILNSIYCGYWNVPYISGSILIKNNLFFELKNILNNSERKTNEDFDMFFCRVIREKYYFMHIVNYTEYGFIVQ